jgi:hypothetical protein
MKINCKIKDSERKLNTNLCSANEVFPLPWAYDCPREKEAKIYDADSRMVIFISGENARARAAIIVSAVNGYEKAMDLLYEAADHIDSYDEGMAGWKDEASNILHNREALE